LGGIQQALKVSQIHLKLKKLFIKSLLLLTRVKRIMTACWLLDVLAISSEFFTKNNYYYTFNLLSPSENQDTSTEICTSKIPELTICMINLNFSKDPGGGYRGLCRQTVLVHAMHSNEPPQPRTAKTPFGTTGKAREMVAAQQSSKD
jgi:hypothetical protein